MSAIDRGIHIASRVPTGYTRDPETRRLVPDEMAPVVAEAFRLRAKGWGWTRLARWFVEQGGSPKTNSSAMTWMVRNRAYLGWAHQGGAVNRSAHPAIVTQLEDRANEVERVEVVPAGASGASRSRSASAWTSVGSTATRSWRRPRPTWRTAAGGCAGWGSAERSPRAGRRCPSGSRSLRSGSLAALVVARLHADERSVAERPVPIGQAHLDRDLRVGDRHHLEDRARDSEARAGTSVQHAATTPGVRAQTLFLRHAPKGARAGSPTPCRFGRIGPGRPGGALGTGASVDGIGRGRVAGATTPSETEAIALAHAAAVTCLLRAGGSRYAGEQCRFRIASTASFQAPHATEIYVVCRHARVPERVPHNVSGAPERTRHRPYSRCGVSHRIAWRTRGDCGRGCREDVVKNHASRAGDIPAHSRGRRSSIPDVGCPSAADHC